MHTDPSTVARRVWELTDPLAQAHGLEVGDVQLRPEPGRLVLRTLLDRPDGGVTLDELAQVSRELGDVLDAHDAVPGRYCLECSSPGVNRPLVRAAHYARVVGQRVRIRTRSLHAGRRTFHGRLASAAEDRVIVDDPDAGTVTIPLDDVDKANVEHDFARPAGRPTA